MSEEIKKQNFVKRSYNYVTSKLGNFFRNRHYDIESSFQAFKSDPKNKTIGFFSELFESGFGIKKFVSFINKHIISKFKPDVEICYDLKTSSFARRHSINVEASCHRMGGEDKVEFLVPIGRVTISDNDIRNFQDKNNIKSSNELHRIQKIMQEIDPDSSIKIDINGNSISVKFIISKDLNKESTREIVDLISKRSAMKCLPVDAICDRLTKNSEQKHIGGLSLSDSSDLQKKVAASIFNSKEEDMSKSVQPKFNENVLENNKRNDNLNSKSNETYLKNPPVDSPISNADSIKPSPTPNVPENKHKSM